MKKSQSLLLLTSLLTLIHALAFAMPSVYRAYRVPYEWGPQLARPVEQGVIPPPNAQFRVGGPSVAPASARAAAAGTGERDAGLPAY